MVVAVEVVCPHWIAVDCRRLPWSVLDGIKILAF